jgi:hypothetical protein
MTLVRLGILIALCASFAPAFLSVQAQQPTVGASRAMLFSGAAHPQANLVGAATPHDGWQNGTESDSITPVRARKLAGYVHMASQKETALSTVIVEECDDSWSRVLSSTKTDYQGHFSLKPAKKRKVHNLRLSGPGFLTRHYAATLAPDAPPELKLELELASKPQSGAAKLSPGNHFASGQPIWLVPSGSGS